MDWSNLKASILRFWAPHCLLCSQPLYDALWICASCEKQLPWVQKGCVICGLPIPKRCVLCAKCQLFEHDFHKIYSVFYYQWPVSQWLQGLKFSQQLFYARLFGQYLNQAISHWYPDDNKPDVLVPVPLSSKRHKHRGYNQVSEILRFVLRQKIPVCDTLCRRIYHTKAQARLNAQQRQANVKGAFQLQGQIPYRHIALVDDVITTQATIESLSAEFKQAGVDRIDVWTLCLTNTQK